MAKNSQNDPFRAFWGVPKLVPLVVVVMMMLAAAHLSMIAERLFSATSFFSFFAPTGSSMINIAWMKKVGSWVLLEMF